MTFPLKRQRSKDQIVRIQGTMKEMLAQGASPAEVQKQLGLPHRTYYHYLDVIIDEWKKQSARKAERLQFQAIERMQKRMDAIMGIYADKESDHYKDPELLMKAQQIEKDIMACFENWGFVLKQPERVQVQHAVITWGTPDFVDNQKEVKTDAKQLEKPKK